MPIDRLPPRLQPVATRLRVWVMSNTTVLVILGIEALWRGVSYLGNPPVTHPSERWFEISTWAVIWVAVGVACLATASFPGSIPAAAAVSLAVGLNALWAGSLITAQWTSHGSSTSWGAGAPYAATTLLVPWAIWRGNRTEFTPREVTRGRDPIR